jgi:hypothetical protein
LANPEFDPERKMALMRDLMAARRAVKDAKSAGEQKTEAEAHRAIDAAREASASGRRTDGASNLKHFICCLVCAGFTTGGR